MTCNAQDIKDRLQKPIVFIGMMGTGKTHVGRMLAEKLDLPFQDSDLLIEKKAGAGIPEIFERDGEAKFRSVEASTILELLEQGPQVISTGGGAPANPETLKAIKTGAVSIWIHSSIPDILSRIKSNTNRPLLNQGDPETILKDLLQKRLEFYKQADLHIENPEGETKKTMEEIMVSLQNLLNKREK